mgnify:CR=1 FL=1
MNCRTKKVKIPSKGGCLKLLILTPRKKQTTTPAAGVEAEIDIYEGLYHAFDMLTPWRKASKLAARRFEEHFLYAKEHYFAKND